MEASKIEPAEIVSANKKLQAKDAKALLNMIDEVEREEAEEQDRAKEAVTQEESTEACAESNT